MLAIVPCEKKNNWKTYFTLLTVSQLHLKFIFLIYLLFETSQPKYPFRIFYWLEQEKCCILSYIGWKRKSKANCGLVWSVLRFPNKQIKSCSRLIYKPFLDQLIRKGKFSLPTSIASSLNATVPKGRLHMNRFLPKGTIFQVDIYC